MTEIYCFRGQTFIVREQEGAMAIVTRLSRNGGERRSAYRADVLRALGQRIGNGQELPARPPRSAVLPPRNGQLVH